MDQDFLLKNFIERKFTRVTKQCEGGISFLNLILWSGFNRLVVRVFQKVDLYFHFQCRIWFIIIKPVCKTAFGKNSERAKGKQSSYGLISL